MWENKIKDKINSTGKLVYRKMALSTIYSSWITISLHNVLPKQSFDGWNLLNKLRKTYVTARAFIKSIK